MHAVVEGLNDVRASERCGGLRFTHEAGERFSFFAMAGADDLDGNRGVQSEVIGCPYGLHPALTEAASQAELIRYDVAGAPLIRVTHIRPG